MTDTQQPERKNAESAWAQNDAFIQATNRTAVESARLALRMVILINGGAAISLLAFVGSVVTQGHVKIGSPQLSSLALTRLWVASGVAAAMFAMGLGYFTNLALSIHARRLQRSWQPPYFVDTPASKRAAWLVDGLRWTTGVLGFGALALFVVGMIGVYSAVIGLV